MNNKKRGFTLIELLITTGFISISSIGAYAAATTANDYRKSSTEVKALNALIQQIDNSTSTVEHYQGISLNSLAFNSALSLADVQPVNKQLTFVYNEVSSRVCNDFASKMLSSSKKISAIVNKSKFDKENIKDIAIACYQDKNDLTIVLNKELNDYSINAVVASVNLPPPAVPEIEIPTFGPTAGDSWTPPEAFKPSTAVPTIYPLTSVAPPVFGPVVGGGGPISVTSPSSPATPQTPTIPNWTPPYVDIPPATTAPTDVIDQDPNPPPPPTFYSKQIKACITGYAVDYLSYSCVNGFVNATLTLTLASPWDNFGREAFTFPRGVEHCTSGAPGFNIGYNQTYPQVTDPEMFWQATETYNPRKMFIKAFNNINSYIFTCSQTG